MLKSPAWSRSFALVALLVLAVVPPAWGAHNGAAQAPDLEVVDASSSPWPLLPGDSPRFTATVRNTGDAAAGDFSVRFLLDGALLLGDIPFRGTLAPGGSVQVTSRAWWNETATSGNHTLAITADIRGSLAEHHEGNNLALWPFVVDPDAPLPDLVIEDIASDPPAIGDLDVPVWTFLVRNAGDAAAGNFSVRARVGNTIMLGDLLGDLPFRGVLPPNATVTMRTKATWDAFPGDYTLTFRADPWGSVRERDETNNLRSMPLHVGFPELLVESVTAPALVGANESFRLAALVRNVGDEDAVTVAVDFQLDGVGGIVRAAGLLAPGATVEVETTRTLAGDFGDHVLRVVVDPYNEVSEGVGRWNGPELIVPPGELNNVVPDRVIRMRGADFAVTSVALDPAAPVVGATATFRVGVANLGDLPRETPLAFRFNGVETLRVTVGSLAPGEEKVLEIPWVAGLPEEQTVEARVDPDNAHREYREDNNAASHSFRVLVPDPAVASLSLQATPLVGTFGASYLGPYALDVVVHNNGTGPTVRDTGIQVTACAKNPPVALQPPCEVIANLTTPAGLAPAVSVTLREDWSAFGNVGDFTFCAQLTYPAVQRDVTNDQGCVDGVLLATLLGRGVRLLP